MRSLKGLTLMLIMISFTMVSYASNHAPPKVKATTEMCFIITPTIDDVCFFNGGVTTAHLGYKMFYLTDNDFNHFAVLNEHYGGYDIDSYYIIFKIGTPTGQIHESKLSENSLRHINRMTNSRLYS